VRLLGPRREGPAEPTLPDDVTGAELERPVRAQLRTLSKANAEVVARHLVMTARLMPEDPQLAYAHAMAAQRRAGRVAVVREAVGVAAYHAGLWAEALSELRAARRMSGSSHQLPLMADAERGLGRPERALELAASPEAASLSTAERVEMAIVVSGARRDLGQANAAVLALHIPELTAPTTHAFTPRLRYAYADALLEAGRREEALSWFAQAADSDQDGETDAEDRLAELQGIVITDLAEDEPEQESEAALPDGSTSEAPQHGGPSDGQAGTGQPERAR
jgi:tetratricopeptide (TPR) repeat protein